MTVLAVRPLERFTTMGRETFLCKFIWEDDWPVVNPGIGMLTDTVEIDLPEWDPVKDTSSYTVRTSGKTTLPGTDKDYVFADMKELGDEFLFLRNYPDDMCKIEADGLKLKVQADDIKAVASPSFVSIRQQHHYFTSTATLDINGLSDNDSAGLVLLQNNLYNLQVVVSGGKANMILCQDGKAEVVGSLDVKDVSEGSLVTVSIKVEGLNTKGFVGDKLLGEAGVSNLSTEVAGGFVGCCIGMYASGNGKEGGYANFKEFTYKKG